MKGSRESTYISTVVEGVSSVCSGFIIGSSLLFDDVARDCRRLGMVCSFSRMIISFSFSLPSIASNSFRICSLVLVEIRRRTGVLGVSVPDIDGLARCVEEDESVSSSAEEICSTLLQTIHQRKMMVLKKPMSINDLLSFWPGLFSSVSDPSILFLS